MGFMIIGLLVVVVIVAVIFWVLNDPKDEQ